MQFRAHVCAIAVLCGMFLTTPAMHAIGSGDVAVVNAYPKLTFQKPLVVTTAPGDAANLYVATRGGQVPVVARDAAATTTTTFLNITDRVNQSGGELGLLGLVFDPNYATNGWFYVNYVNYVTPGPSLKTVIARFTASDDRSSGDPASEQVLLEFPQHYANHMGGWIGFGPDQRLYIATGDGDSSANGQRLDTVFGKVLRN